MISENWNHPTPPWIEVTTFNNRLDNSKKLYHEYYDTWTFDLLEKFNSFPKEDQSISFSELKANPQPGQTIRLVQSDFINGTVRLRVSGYYYLAEDIIFSPNESDNFMPTSAQTSGGKDAEYPIAPFGGYHLGFFAAITIEGENIKLNLNNKVLRQSRAFDIQQRFYANIELASAPFIPKQGPANFGDTISVAKNSYICNGFLGLSSHHGIHGNSMESILIENLNITDFEVAGIALNGGKDILVRNVNICNMSTQVPVLSTYSAGRFILPVLRQLDLSKTLDFASGGMTGTEILNTLETSMNTTKDKLLQGEELADNNIFKNPSGLYDGGGYGIVLNSRGVVVNNFKENRQGQVGNERIILHDIIVDNMTTGQGEVAAISNPCACPNPYGGSRMVGPFGNVLRISDIVKNEQTYDKTASFVANAKLFIAKHAPASLQGTTNIPPSIIAWAEGEQNDLYSVMLSENRHFSTGGDSMGHIMKGLIGIFISAGDNIKVFHSSISRLKNAADLGIANKAATVNSPTVYGPFNPYEGNLTAGLLITGSKNIFTKDITIDLIESSSGNASGIKILHETSNVRSREGNSIKRIICAPQTLNIQEPNPPSITKFIDISDKATNIEIK